MLVSRGLGYLGASRSGLSEDELIDVLSADGDVLRDFEKRAKHEPPEPRLPVVVWSRLYFDLEPYLGERTADGASLMSFYHRQLDQVVTEDYLVEDEERLAADAKRDLHDGRARHGELAAYFADDDRQPLVREVDDKQTPNLRRMSELPYQQTRGEMWEEVFNTLTDFEFLERKAADYGVVRDAAGNPITYTGVFSLQEDYALALERMPGDGGGPRGGRRRIIVTGTDFGKGEGYVIRCPHCNVVHTFDTDCEACPEPHDLDDWVGREVECTNEACHGPLKVNTFTVPPRT
jgi:hypothetical protein